MRRGSKISTVVAALILSFGATVSFGQAGAFTNVFETWESKAQINPFTGSGDVTWIGDLNRFQITSSTWPSQSSTQFGGSNSLRSLTSGIAVEDTVVTAFNFDSAASTTWGVYVSGIASSGDITAARGFDFVLVSDTTNVASIKAGTMNGYRLRMNSRSGTTDSLQFQRAIGSGWATLNFQDFGVGANLTNGWNIAANRSTNGIWTYGFATGPLGTAVTLGNATNDTTVTLGRAAGMSQFSGSSSASGFGFDNFLITSIPEPSVVFLASGTVLILMRIKRNRSVTHS